MFNTSGEARAAVRARGQLWWIRHSQSDVESCGRRRYQLSRDKSRLVRDFYLFLKSNCFQIDYSPASQKQTKDSWERFMKNFDKSSPKLCENLLSEITDSDDYFNSLWIMTSSEFYSIK